MSLYVGAILLFLCSVSWYAYQAKKKNKKIVTWGLIGAGVFVAPLLASFLILVWIVGSVNPDHIDYRKLQVFSLIIASLVSLQTSCHYFSFSEKVSILQYNWLKKFQSFIALVLLIIVMTWWSKGAFLDGDNPLYVMRQISVNMCLAVGMTLVILTGGIDLSVGSVLALTGAIAAGLLKKGTAIPELNLHIGYVFASAVTIAILVGLLLGYFNGWVITKFRIPPFVATLAMLSIARGLTMLWTKSHPITGLGDTFAYLGAGRPLGIPMPVLISAGIVFLALILEKKTRIGRYIFAVGGNEKAARLSGLNVERIKVYVYTIAGGLAAVGGLLVTSRVNSAQPSAGISYELDSIAAVVIGGTSLSGGKGSVWGTVIGAMIIGVLSYGLVLNGVDPSWQLVIKGVVILLAVAIDKFNTKES